MLIVAVNPGHDGAIAVIEDRELLFSLESEKDSFPRHQALTPMSLFDITERIGDVPDMIAIGGWHKPGILGRTHVEAGYHGGHVLTERSTTFCGKQVKLFSSSHIRSHIMMGAGMAPPDDADQRAVLVWEGSEGTFYLLDRSWNVVQEIPVLQNPGGRYSMIFTIAARVYQDFVYMPSLDDSGKLMALAAFGDPERASREVKETVERLLAPEGFPATKARYADAPFYNAGVQHETTTDAAAYLTFRMFEIFAEAAQELIPAGIPLYISGGCGLNCDWNVMWQELGHFSSVFVPPCTNDSGSAVGTALDALHFATGDPRVDWNVYCGLEFEWDSDPDPGRWQRRELDLDQLSVALASGRIVAWVQGRWEMGPRALGNRSLLAEPSSQLTRDALNRIKQRESYRPIAPCCRLEDAGKAFNRDFHDPYMLYFRRVAAEGLAAVMHVDGTARVQTVTAESNPPLHDLLSAFAERKGLGVLCNTSLNFQGTGFINRMSDLTRYCEINGVSDFVVGDTWYKQIPPGTRPVQMTPARADDRLTATAA